MQYSSLKKHLLSENHKKSQQESERRRIREVEREERARRQDEETMNRAAQLQSLQEVAKTNQRQLGDVENLAEAEMWEEFERDVDQILFAAGENPEKAADVDEARWNSRADSFGLWNAHKAAKELGFGGNTEEDNMSEDELELGDGTISLLNAFAGRDLTNSQDLVAILKRSSHVRRKRTIMIRTRAQNGAHMSPRRYVILFCSLSVA